jgi:NADPH:quinone reductase-like Zn-dependent oxidoreductase
MQGSFSEYIKVPIHQIAKAPSSTTTNVSMEEIATLPLVGLTAWQSLSPYVIPYQSNVLILGGSGGTGHVAIQIAAKALHAKSVTTVCSTRNIEFVKECGATHVVDYSKVNDVIEALQRLVDDKCCCFDVILDCVTSGDPRDAQYQYPTRIRNANNPSIVTQNHLYQRLGGQWTDWIRAGLARWDILPHSWLWNDPRERLFWIQFPHSSNALDEITKFVEEGKLKPHLQKIYPNLTADTVNQAFNDLLSRRVQGKIAITVTRDNEEEEHNDNAKTK